MKINQLLLCLIAVPKISSAALISTETVDINSNVVFWPAFFSQLQTASSNVVSARLIYNLQTETYIQFDNDTTQAQTINLDTAFKIEPAALLSVSDSNWNQIDQIPYLNRTTTGGTASHTYNLDPDDGDPDQGAGGWWMSYTGPDSINESYDAEVTVEYHLDPATLPYLIGNGTVGLATNNNIGDPVQWLSTSPELGIVSHSGEIEGDIFYLWNVQDMDGDVTLEIYGHIPEPGTALFVILSAGLAVMRRRG